MGNQYLYPDYYFEVSWEVCNMVGGIYTVLSTKALTVRKRLNDKHILVGPDIWRESGDNPAFAEDRNLYAAWRAKAAEEGLRIRTGRWRIPGEPVAIILDFTTFMEQKDQIFGRLWELYKLDSISGQWDYIEPALFGYGAGRVIESFARHNLSTRTRVVAQFHEWMTGAGLLHLKSSAPQIATVFTTHATVIGRAIAGNRLPLYDRLTEYDGDSKSNDFNVVSKQSMEKLSAWHADAFTTVSDLTATECRQLLKKEVCCVTPNGFDISLVPPGEELENQRMTARKQLIAAAEALIGHELPEDICLLATSGRYEYNNKGMDLYLEALAKLNRQADGPGRILAYLLVPANHYGPRKELLEALNSGKKLEGNRSFLTHSLHDAEYDPILNRIRELGFENRTDEPVKLVFVPSYLNGDDGLFNRRYFELLPGFDLTVFPSYYEPWGYTPLESLAFGVPTITTTLAGFGLWIRQHTQGESDAVRVIERTDANYPEAVAGIASAIQDICRMNLKEYRLLREQARELAGTALWEKQIDSYYQAFHHALLKMLKRTNLFVDQERQEFIGDRVVAVDPEWRAFAVQEKTPGRFSGLNRLARNLWWSWNTEASELFASIDRELWTETGENPIALLQRIPLDRFRELENDQDFIGRMSAVLKEFNDYLMEGRKAGLPKVAYFSMEFGLHHTLRIYSGGLGVLAGDFLKEASDANRDMVGIGLLYRNGYFTQIISGAGEQLVANEPQDYSAIPVEPVRDADGNWKTVSIAIPGRTLAVRIWRVDVGRVPLYLLDTDFEANLQEDRQVTHHLYGGDNANRLVQEILLGIGGIRALEALDVKPDLYHCNEGHAAFIGFERLRGLISGERLTFQEALEVVRSSTLFTTHTPVPAGHDSFDEHLIRMYMAHYPDRFNISWEQFIGLGRLRPEDRQEKFSMSYLAINLSQEVNGVSRLHGKVTQEMFAGLWKGYNPDELHVGYVTNGVHLPTWTAGPWLGLYRRVLGGDFLSRQSDGELWRKVLEVPDRTIWEIRNRQRGILIEYIRERLRTALVQRRENPRYIMEALENLKKDALTIGFARRFATYKRAHLLFRDKERLARIINREGMPLQFIFAGKAHPRDKAGQELIRMIVELSKEPAFTGRIIFLENYDMQLARKLVQGVDIWLNTPTRPLEASGTSGQKAVLNGALHFSVLDGWWAEGYVEGAGWAIEERRTYENQDYQDELDAETIYSMLENEIVPAYYQRDDKGIPGAWTGFIRKSIAEIAPRFTFSRMLDDYTEKYYNRLYRRSEDMKRNDYDMARELAAWKKIVLRLWNDIEVISFNHPDISQNPVTLGESYQAELVLDLHHLSVDHVGVELVIRDFGNRDNEGGSTYTQELQPESRGNGHVCYETTVTPVKPGTFDYGIRIFARHPHLSHRQDFPLVRWV